MDAHGRAPAGAGSLAAARRELGWSQIQAAGRLAAVAAQHGLAVASTASLKTQLSRWENGHTLPDEQYRALLAELYGRDQQELGIVPIPGVDVAAEQAEALRGRLAAAASVDDEAVRLLRDQLDASRRLEHRLGAAAVSDAVRGQLTQLERVLAHALSLQLRRELASVLAETAAMAGSHALDAGAVADAWRHYETAKGAAREAGSPPLLGYALAEQAEVLLDVGETAAAVHALDHADEITERHAPPPLRAWLAGRRGAALAAAGDSRAARRALDRAEREFRLDVSGPPPSYVELDDAAPHRWRGHAFTLLAEPRAVEHLQRALESTDSSSARAEAGTRVDLVAALTAADRPAEAGEQARLARELTTMIGSARLRGHIERTLSGG